MRFGLATHSRHHRLPPVTIVLATDGSALARSMIEQGLSSMGVPYILTKTGKEAWSRLQAIHTQAQAEGTAHEKVALALTDLEMPEMDGFTLTRNIQGDFRFKSIPVIIHSSLTGAANEGHVKTVGADACFAKFAAGEQPATLRVVLSSRWMPCTGADRHGSRLAIDFSLLCI